MTPSIDAQQAGAIAGDAQAFAYQLDLIQRRLLFLRLGQQDVQSASFLDERLGTAGRDGFWLPLESLSDVAEAIAPSPAPMFIFHIGHCGSTLLSRMLETFGNVQALREPMVLRALAAAHDELESPLSRLSGEHWNELLRAMAKLLARPFSPDQRILIKATSTCNNLIEPLLSMPGSARAMLLHVPLETYLATMLKGAGGGIDALHAAPARLRYLHSLLGDKSLRLYQMDHAEILAMGWLAELARFDQIEARFRDSRQIMRSNFEDILEFPEWSAREIAGRLGLAFQNECQAPSLGSQVMTTYSKSPEHAYSRSDREHDLNLSRRTFAPQLAQGMRWAEKQLDRYPTLQALAPHLR